LDEAVVEPREGRFDLAELVVDSEIDGFLDVALDRVVVELREAELGVVESVDGFSDCTADAAPDEAAVEPREERFHCAGPANLSGDDEAPLRCPKAFAFGDCCEETESLDARDIGSTRDEEAPLAGCDASDAFRSFTGDCAESARSSKSISKDSC
jgi:hypothetical protein